MLVSNENTTGRQANHEPEGDNVAVVVNNEQTGAGHHPDWVHTVLEVERRNNILEPLEVGGIHCSLAVVVAVDLGGTLAEVRHSNHLLPYCPCG